jgi:RHS repeat-associated protein
MLVPNRHKAGDDYRYGFQGQEKDDEIRGGEGNSINYTFRMHDPRVGRFLSIDPLFREYPHNSTYAFQENKLGLGTELEGRELQEHIWLATDAAIHPNGVGAHIMGFGEGLSDTVVGIWDAVTSPVKTVKGTGNLIVWGVVGSQFSKQVDNTLGTSSTEAGDAFLNSVYNGGNNLINGNGEQRGRVVGNIAGSILGAKGLDKLGKIAKLAIYNRCAVLVDAKLIRFSQKTMNGPIFDKIVGSMKAKGWSGKAIDVVEMKDGMYTALDNKRLAAAQETGIQAKVNVYKYDDVLPKARADAFEKQYKTRPNTYGEAAELRIKNQGNNFSTNNPNGATEQPRATYPKAN